MNNETNWTPGEWWVNERTTNGVKGYEICWSPSGEAVTDHVYGKDDAYLMAAAKDMYQALEQMLEECTDDEFAPHVIDARDALAKARGDA